MSRGVKRKALQNESGETKFLKSASGPPEVNVTVPKSKDLPKPKKSVKLHDGQLPIDFLLLTVKECEFLSCLAYMKRYSRTYHDDLPGHAVYLGDMGKKKVAVMKCHKGSTGPASSSYVARDAVKVLRPKAVFSVGFCGGLNTEKIKLGDVVVAEKLITYAPSKVNPDGIEECGVRVPLRNHLAKLILNAHDGWEAPLKDPSELKVEVRRGPLLSGPEVVASNERRNQLIERFPDGIAIEMEGEGVFAAAQALNVEWIIIKGVSDYADGKKSDTNSWRPFASLMAASLTAHILSDPIAFETLPHYGRGNTTSPSSDPSASVSSTTAKRKGESSFAVKAGSPSEDELEELSTMLGGHWEKLGRRLGFDRAKIYAFHKENERLSEKAYEMLMDWKQKEGSDGTYQVLYDALCHRLVGCKGIAKQICCV